MENNIVYLYNHSTEKEKKGRYHQNTVYQTWFTAIADSIFSITISVCTIFCIYLAYTML